MQSKYQNNSIGYHERKSTEYHENSGDPHCVAQPRPVELAKTKELPSTRFLDKEIHVPRLCDRRQQDIPEPKRQLRDCGALFPF